MIGDVLLIKDRHRNVAKEIVQYMIDKVKIEDQKKFTLGIAGESGSGKSEVSHQVARELKKMGLLTKIFHLDNYYKVPPAEREPWRKEDITRVGLQEINWDKLHDDLFAFKNNKTDVKLPCIDLLTDQIDTLITDFSDIRVGIVDGLYSLNADVELKIMIDMTYHQTRKAQLVRGKETYDEHRVRVLEQEHEAVQSLRDQVNLFIDENFKLVEATPEKTYDY